MAKPNALPVPSALADYHRKRDFTLSPEPAGKPVKPVKSSKPLSFVVQKHAARSLHYDFRLELDGTLKSWAVPKGPSLDPADKRMAVQVEDHPLAYADFEGDIPPGHYGAGHVSVWDRGRWTPEGDPRAGYRDGKLKFTLEGDKLQGRWALVRMRGRDVEGRAERQPAWLLMKERDASGQKEAARADLPAQLSPQLATLVDAPPAGGDWLYEIKFDGYRLLTRIEGKSVRCFTRNGHDWSHKLPELVAALRALKLAPCWLDGELVAPDAAGQPDFQALQNAFDAHTTRALSYFLFDLPFHDGRDLRAQPLTERRARLRSLLHAAPPMVRFSEAFDSDPQRLLASARAAGLEGLIGKRKDSTYRSQRSPDWVKLKTLLRQEFVVAGYTEPQGGRTGLGALLLGVHDAKGVLRPAGKVGTGFDDATRAALKKTLTALHQARSPFDPVPKAAGRGAGRVQWVRPTLVAEVSFAQWTQEGRIRHAVFHGLRKDKPAQAVTKDLAEKPTGETSKKSTQGGTQASGRARVSSSMRVTHPGRVVDADSGLTKGDLVAYCDAVAPLLLPHLRERPVALLRAPSGVAGPQFFQKHAEATELPGVRLLDPALDPGHAALLTIPTREGLLSAAQMNVIELHTWNMLVRSMPRPDRMMFDLDPGSGVAWPAVREAAVLVRGLLDELGLASCLKTSGGKGLHLVVPLAPRQDWQTVRQFSQAIVVHLATVIPQRFVAKSGPRNRVGKIFVDYLRNGWGSTTVAAWSVRARPGLGVSVPIAWDELDEVDGGAHWTVQNVEARFAVGNQPWAALAKTRQGLARAMKRLGFDPAQARG